MQNLVLRLPPAVPTFRTAALAAPQRINNFMAFEGFTGKKPKLSYDPFLRKRHLSNIGNAKVGVGFQKRKIKSFFSAAVL